MCDDNSCGPHRNPCVKLGPFTAANSNCRVPEATKTDNSSIVVFSSGYLILPILEFSTGGTIKSVSSIGFGTSINGITLNNQGEIDLLANTYADIFTIPRTGSVTAISANYITIIRSTPLRLGDGIATINARIYKAAKGSNILIPTDATVNLAPTLTGTLTNITTIHSGSSSTFTPIPVAPEECLLLVFSISVAGNPAVVGASIERGKASAGITIE